MKEIVADTNLIGYCGLYCGACKRYLKDKCPGCHENEKATWCKIRTCCSDNSFTGCADCTIVENLADCKKFNNLPSKIFEFIFRSNRSACVSLIREKGYEQFAQEMADKKIMTIKKGI